MMPRHLPRTCSALVLFTVAVAAQQPAPSPLSAPRDVLNAFELRDGTIQELLLPQRGRQRFEVQVVLGSRLVTLALAPSSVLAPNFQLLVTDDTGTHPVPTPEETTYTGTVLGAADSVVAATLEDGQLDAYIRMPGEGWSIQPLTDVMAVAPRHLHAVYRHADVIRSAGVCGVDHHDEHEIIPGGGGSAGPSALQYCELAIDCDQPYYLRNGSSVSQTFSAVIGAITAVNAIYIADAEIRHIINSIVVRTVVTYTTGPDLGCGASPGLLQEFRTRWLANHTNIPRDTAHMFSGAGAFSGTVGCAYVGVICSSLINGGGFGVSRAISANAATNVALIAHEIGHNWSATHCNATPPCNIMCSSIGGCTGVGTSFGAPALAQIVAHRNSRTCLSSPVKVDPNPAVYYRLSTQFQPTLALDVINDGNTNEFLHMVPAGPFTGQYWRFQPTGFNPSTYYVSCLWQGENRTIDIFNGGAMNNQPHLATKGPFTGQFWNLTTTVESPGYVHLTTDFRGPGLALEGHAGTAGNRPELQSIGPFTGQFWKLTPLASVDPAESVPFGAACRGRGGVPSLQLINGTAPWVGESISGEVTNVLAGMFSELIIGSELAAPIDLAFINSPGCFLRVNLTFRLLNQVGGGRATFTLPIPYSVDLVGQKLSTQCSVIDPSFGGGNPFIAMSNGLSLRFGLR